MGVTRKLAFARMTVGQQGEAAAVRFLESHNYLIVDVNVRLSDEEVRGELDIVAWDGDTLCFIEVKTRRSTQVAPAEAVTPAKQQQIVRLATLYMARQEVLEETCIRFDVVAVRPARSAVKEDFDMTLIQGAFMSEE